MLSFFVPDCSTAVFISGAQVFFTRELSAAQGRMEMGLDFLFCRLPLSLCAFSDSTILNPSLCYADTYIQRLVGYDAVNDK